MLMRRARSEVLKPVFVIFTFSSPGCYITECLHILCLKCVVALPAFVIPSFCLGKIHLGVEGGRKLCCLRGH